MEDNYRVSNMAVGQAVVRAELDEWINRGLSNTERIEEWAAPGKSFWEGYRAGLMAARSWVAEHASHISILQFVD